MDLIQVNLLLSCLFSTQILFLFVSLKRFVFFWFIYILFLFFYFKTQNMWQTLAEKIADSVHYATNCLAQRETERNMRGLFMVWGMVKFHCLLKIHKQKVWYQNLVRKSSTLQNKLGCGVLVILLSCKSV